MTITKVYFSCQLEAVLFIIHFCNVCEKMFTKTLLFTVLLWAGHQKVKGEGKDQKPLGDLQWRKKGKRQVAGRERTCGLQQPIERRGKALGRPYVPRGTKRTDDDDCLLCGMFTFQYSLGLQCSMRWKSQGLGGNRFRTLTINWTIITGWLILW